MLRRLSASDVVSLYAYELRKAKFNSRQAEISKYKRSIRSNRSFTTGEFSRVWTFFTGYSMYARDRLEKKGP